MTHGLFSRRPEQGTVKSSLVQPAAGVLLRLDMHATDMFHLLRGEPLSVSADVQRPAMCILPPDPA